MRLIRRLIRKHNAKLDYAAIEVKKDHYEQRINELLTTSQIPATVDAVDERLTQSIRKAAEEFGKTTRQNKTILSDRTKDLLETRRALHSKPETSNVVLSDINKQAKQAVRRDVRQHRYKTIVNTIEKYRGPKVFRKKLVEGNKQIHRIKDANGRETNDLDEIMHVVEQFYEKLYTSRIVEPLKLQCPRAKLIRHFTEDLPDISLYEIKSALKSMKNEKAPGEDGVPVELLKLGGKTALLELQRLFNQVLMEGITPKPWKNALVTLIYKKGEKTQLNNYRPISILLHTYKLFTKVLTNRLANKLDTAQPIEQAGFRRGFSTIDHIFVVRQLIEKCVEYNQDLCVAFVDYEKAFDTVEHWAVFHSLQRCMVDTRYVEVLKEIYKGATLQVKLHEVSRRIPVGRGVRQGDTISPKLFTAALEDVFKLLEWSEKGVSINGSMLSHLRFADDLVLFAKTPDDIKVMLEELHDASLAIGLRMNMLKTKFMSNSKNITPAITIYGQNIDRVEEYVYLGQMVTLDRNAQTREVDRRIQLGWAAFGKLSDVFKDKQIPTFLKRRTFEQCILPVMTYASETWTLTKHLVNKLQVAQRSMERAILGIH
ncbi:unnamed protein product [Colias eurytheme]|nr:unnamed protein product [Colias eurytheme]